MRAEPNILVVEDNPGDAHLYEKALLRVRHAGCFLQKSIYLDQLLGTLDAAASFWLTAALLPSRR